MENHPIRLVLLLMAGAMLVIGQLYVTLPMTMELATYWQVTPEQATWTGSAFGFAYAAGFLLLGRLSDRYGRRPVLLCSLVATALASLAVASATGFGMLLGARVVQGVIAAAFPPAALALVAEALPGERRALGISLMSFAFLAAAPLSQFLAGEFAGHGLPVIMLGMAVAYMLLAVCLGSMLPVRARTIHAVHCAPPVRIWAQRELVGVWMAAVTVLFAFVMFHGGTQAAGFPSSDLQTLRLAGLPPLLLTLAAAPMVQRIGTVATARTGLVVAAFGLLVGLAGSFWWLLVASFLLSAGIALAVPGLIGTIASRTTPDNRARALSLYTFSLFVGASIAPPLAQALAPYGWWLLLTPTVALLCGARVVRGTPI